MLDDFLTAVVWLLEDGLLPDDDDDDDDDDFSVGTVEDSFPEQPEQRLVKSAV